MDDQLVKQFAALRERHAVLARQRGDYINRVVQVEALVDDIIASFFGVPSELRTMFYGTLLQRTNLRTKAEIVLPAILSARDLREACGPLLKRLDAVRIFRNSCAHASAWGLAEVPPPPPEPPRLTFHQYGTDGEPKTINVDEALMDAKIEEADAVWRELLDLRTTLEIIRAG